MGKLGEKWKKLADRKIYINNSIEISVGRLIFLTTITIMLQFSLPVALVIPFFSIKKRDKKADKTEEDG